MFSQLTRREKWFFAGVAALSLFAVALAVRYVARAGPPEEARRLARP